jgi:hypothetical protein
VSSLAEMTYRTRELIRDFPVFFEAEQGPLNTLTIRLEHPYVSQALQVFITDVAGATPVTEKTTKWELDERNGLLKLTDDSYQGQRLLVAGYHYKWFTDSDLMGHVQDVVHEFTYDTHNEADDLSEVEADVAALGAVVRALWSLSIELALDIDVSTPEGMFIPAHQRYQQVVGMMQHWEAEYNNKAASLNVGLGKVEIYQLRRVAKLTNRYIPVYVNQEVDDRRRPQRVRPVIPDLGGTTYTEIDVIEVAESYRRGQGMWSGWSGSYPSMGYPETLGRGTWVG